MRKLLKITALTCAFASNSFAHIGDLMYVRGDATWSQFNHVSMGSYNTTTGQYNDPMTIPGGTYSNNSNFGAIFGIGYIVDEKLRVEAIYNRIYASKFKYSNSGTGTLSKIRADVNAFLGRVAYDVYEIGQAQLFVGAGLGIANVRHKVTGKTNALITTGPAVPPALAPQSVQSTSYSFKSKNKNNPAYSVMLGIAIKATDNLHLELAYNFTSYGKTSRVEGLGGGQIALKSQNISLGLRYDLM